MKKFILIFILLVSFGSYSQTSTKKCSCCSKSTVVHHKKPIKKKKHIVKPIVNTLPQPSIIVNNITNNTIIYQEPETKEVEIDTVIKVIEKPVALKRDTPEFEVYAGVVNPKEINTLGYMVGFNILPNLHQIGKNGKEREYLNKYLFGFEFSGYKTNPQIIELPTNIIEQMVTPVDCNCEETTFGGFSNGLRIGVNQEVKGLSLNFGVEIYKGWYLISGVTSYQRKLILDGKSVNTSYSTFIDAGIKKFFKVGNVYLSPTIKFNEQTSSFGLGFSYD